MVADSGVCRARGWGRDTPDLRQGTPCLRSAEAPVLSAACQRGHTTGQRAGSKGRAHLGLGREDRSVDKGAFSSKHVGVFVSGLKHSQPGSPSYSDKHRTRLAVAGGAPSPWSWGEVP